MIEDGFNHVRRDPKPGHAACGGSSKIVENPSRWRRDSIGVIALRFGVRAHLLKDCSVNRFLRAGKTGYGRLACGRKN